MAQLKDLGQKFTCFKCECKFYDLGAPSPNCPRCGADQRESPDLEPVKPPSKSRSKKKAPAPKPVVDAGAAPEVEEEGDSLLDDDFDDTSVEEGLKGAVADRLPDGVSADDAKASGKQAAKADEKEAPKGKKPAKKAAKKAPKKTAKKK